MRPDIDIRSHLDTRGSRILLVLSLLSLLGFAVLGGLLQPVVMPTGIADLEVTVIAMMLPLGLIIPIITVLIVAGEWSDRSIQVTLLQRPGRLGVLASKTLAALAVSGAIVLLSFALAAATTWIGGEAIGQGASFESLEGVLTTQLAAIAATLLFSLAMGILTQSMVIGLVAAIGAPFVIGTAGTIAAVMGSEVFTDVVRAADLQSAALQLSSGEAGGFELIPLVLLVLTPAALGIWRWSRREVG